MASAIDWKSQNKVPSEYPLATSRHIYWINIEHKINFADVTYLNTIHNRIMRYIPNHLEFLYRHDLTNFFKVALWRTSWHSNVILHKKNKTRHLETTEYFTPTMLNCNRALLIRPKSCSTYQNIWGIIGFFKELWPFLNLVMLPNTNSHKTIKTTLCNHIKRQVNKKYFIN